MKKPDCTTPVLDACVMLKIPVSLFKEWRNGETDEFGDIPHPEYAIRSGKNYRYSMKSLEETAKLLPKDDYYPECAVRMDVWTSTAIALHGRVNLLAQSKDAPVSLRLSESGTYQITMAGDTVDTQHSARDILGRRISDIANVDRIKSAYEFPGAEFIVEKVG